MPSAFKSRGPRARRPSALLALAASALALGLSSAYPGAAGAASRTYFVEYAGSYDEVYDQGEAQHGEAHYTFSLTGVVEPDEASYAKSAQLRASGTIFATSNTNGDNCSGMLSQQDRSYTPFVQVNRSSVSGDDTLTAFGTLPSVLLDSSWPGTEGLCAASQTRSNGLLTSSNNSVAHGDPEFFGCCDGSAAQPKVVLPGGQRSASRRFQVTATDPNPPETTSVDATLTITFCPNGNCPDDGESPPDGSPAEVKRKAKEFALGQARKALVQSVAECGALAQTAKGFAGTLAAAAALGVAPEGSFVLALVEAASAIKGQLDAIQALQGNPVQELRDQANTCGMTIAWFLKAYQVFKDPPSAGFSTVALARSVRPRKLPGVCSRYHGRLLAACRKLKARELAVAVATGRVAGVYAAISTATDRLTGATAAGNAKAEALQGAALKALHLELARRLAALGTAKRKLAQRLESYLGAVTLPAEATDQIAAFVTQRLSGLGISAADLQDVAPPSGPLDLLATLRQPLDASGAAAVGASITIADLKTLTASVVRGRKARPLLAHLKAAQRAGGAKRKKAVRKFIQAAKGIHSPAGELLSAAAGPLAH